MKNLLTLLSLVCVLTLIRTLPVMGQTPASADANDFVDVSIPKSIIGETGLPGSMDPARKIFHLKRGTLVYIDHLQSLYYSVTAHDKLERYNVALEPSDEIVKTNSAISVIHKNGARVDYPATATVAPNPGALLIRFRDLTTASQRALEPELKARKPDWVVP